MLRVRSKEAAMLSFRILLTSFFVIVAFGQATFSQQASSSSSQLALEVYFYPNEPPAYQKIYKSQSGGAWYSRFHQIKSNGPSDLPVNAVDIKPSFTEDGIRVTVSVLFGELHEKEK